MLAGLGNHGYCAYVGTELQRVPLFREQPFGPSGLFWLHEMKHVQHDSRSHHAGVGKQQIEPLLSPAVRQLAEIRSCSPFKVLCEARDAVEIGQIELEALHAA